MRISRLACWAAILCAGIGFTATAQQARIDLDGDMVVDDAGLGAGPRALMDEQDQIIGPPVGQPSSDWKASGDYPKSFHLDLGSERFLASLWLFDRHGKGDVVIAAGEPGDWREVARYDCGQFMAWAEIKLDVATRYLQITRMSGGAQFSEIALYEHTPEAWKTMQAQQAAAEKARREREEKLAQAKAEIAAREPVDLGEPIGLAYLIDEIDCSVVEPSHEFTESPAGVSEVQTLLGKQARVLKKTAGEGAYFSYRIGKFKPLIPGETYVLQVEYPEDKPRTITVLTRANESIRTFHTGSTVGDALHPKYVNNLPESLQVPLSGQYENWTMLFNLHDRFTGLNAIRGDGTRPDTPEDGFLVTIAQFSARNIPLSEGAAVSRIRLFAVPNMPERHQALRLPPEGLPQRHIFWREEMADGVIQSAKEEERGLKNPIDWYRYKAMQMKLLGMNTYTKDLLEFGAVQHWDSRAGGGHQWAYYSDQHKHLWSEIVTLMGDQGFNILPYYEYSGSKGSNSLGAQRRATPLTRDGDYTHIAWRDKYNVDLTDPDTYADFQKYLDLTIIRHTDKAHFVGAWLRNRGQIPMSFATATRKRFSDQSMSVIDGVVSRQQLIDEPELLQEYYTWWFQERRKFLTTMRDHLRQNGVGDDALMLYTASPSEPGEGFKTWTPIIVTDDIETWAALAQKPEHANGDRKLEPVSIEQIIARDLYMDALLKPSGTWGDWEWQHLAPPSDPQNYTDTDGVLISHAFNRAYTVADPRTFDTFRGPSGLAIVRHYSLNENMMFDLNDQNKLGYFCTDVERAGPYCMMAEAMAMANGDPTMIGYLLGTSHARGFPYYVRRFNAAYLSLPALPSQRLQDAASDAEVVVRQIQTPQHGSYLAIVNTGMQAKAGVTVQLPTDGAVTDAATGETIAASGAALKLDLYPFELRAIHIK